MIRRMKIVCLLAFAMLLPRAAHAEHTRYWKQTDFADFQKGTAKGVAVRSDGKLRPALKFASFADPNLAYVWALRLNSKGQLYAAGGSDAKVLRFDDAGKPTPVFESAELAAQAIAFDSADNLYVGTSPDGKVYQVTPDGKKTVFFEPKTKYIWALAVDPKGTLFVATGDTGEVFAVTPDGQGQLFYQSRERHARSLAFDFKGNLLIGTEPDGLVVRVEITRKTPNAAPTAGAPFVVYETNKAEVTSLVTDADGNIYAASIGDKVRGPSTPVRLPATVAPPATLTTVTGGGTITTQSQPAPGQTNIVFPFPAIATGGGAEVVKIAPDGSPETLWTSRDDLVLSMGMSLTGKLLLGTGNNGTVVELEGDSVYSSLASTASEQVTSIVAAAGGKVFVATANPGKIFTLGPGSEPNGAFESEAFDAKIFSRWGHLTWWGDNGATDNKVEFYVRSGNTSTPEDNWSAWSGPYKNASGDAVTCPAARFVQWKAVFLAGDQGAASGLAPGISWVSLAYQPKNVAPVVDDVVMEDPGIRATGFPMQPNSGAPAAQLKYARIAGAPAPMQASGSDASNNFKNEPPPQGTQQKGYQSVLWSAHDDNDDDLLFTVYFRAESEKDWRVLKDKLTQHYYSWDTSSMPDGAYYLKIVASDSPSNPADQALWGARESDRWTVANTPPRIENLRAGSGLLNTKASFDAIAASSSIARAEYSIDAGDWVLIFPTDVLSDAPKESYFMQLPGYPPGDHTLAVQITDDFGNTATAKVNFTVQPRNTGK
jgi:sugar lactone lactonase YvrE